MAEAFDHNAAAIRQKEGLARAPTAHLLAAEDVLDDGTRISLWVSDPTVGTGVRSRCFYLDTESPDGQASGYGSCGAPDTLVSLSRNGDVVVGSVGTWPAGTVRVAVAGQTAELTVTGGYFLVPVRLVGPEGTPLTLTLAGADGQPIGVIANLVAPGAAVPAR